MSFFGGNRDGGRRPVCLAPCRSRRRKPSPPARDFSTYIPTGQATRIEAAEAPTIDGLLDDPVWAKAEVIDEFYQLDPDTGQPAPSAPSCASSTTTRTSMSAIYNYDREPHLISATQRSRDGNLGVDDSVRIYLDPLNSRRNSYFFEVNAAGAKHGRADPEQHRLHQGVEHDLDRQSRRSSMTAGSSRWRLPFRNFAFDPAKPDWVFELFRTHQAQGRAHPLEHDQRRDPVRRHLALGHADRDQRHRIRGSASTCRCSARCAIAMTGRSPHAEPRASAPAATPSTRSRRSSPAR